MARDIRTIRLEIGLQHRELARLVRVAPGVLSKWERGLEMPPAEAIKELAAALNRSESTIRRTLREHRRAATPGEGYTTAQAAAGEVVPRRANVPRGSRRVVDLFCGAGGLSFGFEQTGDFVATCGVDLLSDRIASFTANHKHAVGVAGDLRELSVAELERHAGDVDVLVGGPPCQGFSSIRPFRTLTEGDPRNTLIEHYVLLVGKLQPEWFVFENVVGILTHQGGTRLGMLLQGLRGLGYAVDWRVINAALLGVPQHRERVIVVGSRRGIEYLWPEPSHQVAYKSMAGRRPEVVSTSPLFCAGLPPALTIAEAIDDLPPVQAGEEVCTYGSQRPRTAYQRAMRQGAKRLTLHRATRHSERMLEIIRHAGTNKNDLPKGMVTSGFSSSYSRLSADQPSTTLTVNFVHPASNRCIHPSQDRALTPREGARLQGFPDRFEFRGTSAQIVKQIGNAVPPITGQALAESILRSEEAARRRWGSQRRTLSANGRSEP